MAAVSRLSCCRFMSRNGRYPRLLLVLLVTCLIVLLTRLIIVTVAYKYRRYDGDDGFIYVNLIRLHPTRLFAGAPQRKAHSYTSRSCYLQVQYWDGSDTAQEPEDILPCPGVECGVRVMKDRSFETMMKSDVLVHDFLLSLWFWPDMLRMRPSHQAWAFWTAEATPLPRQDLQHVYNYSITYRRTSTFYDPYGRYDETTPQVPPDDNRNWADGKTNMVAWTASNCHITSWRRLEFVKELSKHMQVDIYGGCGKPGCERFSDSCRDLLRTYKFYLAVENNACTDYITEKFWENALQNDIVPIVYGARKEDYEAVAPPNSFIHLEDFTSMGDLVKYLNLLNSNDTLYNAYFEWKRHGSISDVGPNMNMPCLLISKYLDARKGLASGLSREGANETIYNDWRIKGCREPTGFPQDF